MSQKILRQIGVGNTPILQIVVVEGHAETVAIESINNPSNRIEIDAAMLELLANGCKKAYKEFYSSK